MEYKTFDLDQIISEWHPTKNGDLKFHDLATGSGKPTWWLGQCGHEWETKMFLRAVRGTGCPYCSNRMFLSGFNDIATKHPEWVEFWSPSNELPCNQVLSGGKPEYAWLCELGHEFYSSVGHKERGRSCPYCCNAKILQGFNDLATVAPEVAKSWHPTKNGELTPSTVIAGGTKKHWWLCEEGHSWETHIRRRLEGAGCLICAGQVVLAGYNDLASQAPEIAAEWHPTKNGNQTPEQVMVRSKLVFWWQCSEGHEWETKVLNRTLQGNSCKECKKTSYSLKEDNLLVTHPDLASQWHPTKNGALSPRHITVGSRHKVWWLGACNHEWEALVYSRVHGNGCPVCRGLKAVAGINDLAFVSPNLALEWHPTKNEGLSPQQVTVGSRKRVWWLGSCNHEWEASIAHRSNGSGCPVCSGHTVISGINDLQTIQPELAAQWHPTKNGNLTPDDITGKGGRGKAWWLCDKGHEWESNTKLRILRGYGCPQCWATSYISKAEQELHDFICSLDETMKVIQSDKKVLKGKELDIYIPDKNIAIEFNGLFWHSEAAGKAKNYHYDKWMTCKQQGIQLIQIWEDDWARSKEQVKGMIAHKLGYSSQRKVFARKTVVASVSKNAVEDFFETNHIQGFASGSYYVGLFEKQDTEHLNPLAVLILKKEGGTDEKVLNIIRYATSANVVGGFTKLMKYAVVTYSPESFITFADHCVSDGGLYENNGFVADKELAPSYMYIVNGERKHKFGYRLKRFQNDPELEWVEGLSERELADLNGLERIWDAGKTRYLYKVG